MTLLTAFYWGLAGAGAVEASELYGAIRTVRDFPWRVSGELKFSPYLITVLLRLALGAFAAGLCAKAGPLGPAAAVAAGIAAPKLLEELGRHSVGVPGLGSSQRAHQPAPASLSVASAPASDNPAARMEGGLGDATK
jgi:hypothetical protein